MLASGNRPAREIAALQAQMTVGDATTQAIEATPETAAVPTAAVIARAPAPVTGARIAGEAAANEWGIAAFPPVQTQAPRGARLAALPTAAAAPVRAVREDPPVWEAHAEAAALEAAEGGGNHDFGME